MSISLWHTMGWQSADGVARSVTFRSR